MRYALLAATALVAACATKPAEQAPVRVGSPPDPTTGQVAKAMEVLGSPLNSPVSGAAQAPKVTGGERTPSLEAMMAKRPKVIAGEGADGMRARALCETAEAYGAAGGFAAYNQKVMAYLRSNETAFDQGFDFTPLIQQAGPRVSLVPPVVTEQHWAVALKDGGQIARSTGRVLEIAADARLAGGTPDWRTYLVPVATTVQKSDEPPEDMLPKTDKEADAWRDCVAKGWAVGEAHANTTYLTGLGQLQQDMVGGMRGLVLVKAGLVQPTRVTVQRKAVTGGGNLLRMDDTEMRITGQARLNADTSRWRPLNLPSAGPIGGIAGPRR